jgi:hypothetical protein
VDIEIPRGGITRVSFLTDVRNNYFSRGKNPGRCRFEGDFSPTYRLFNGRIAFACRADKSAQIGAELSTQITITDPKGSGPFQLTIYATVVRPVKKPSKPPKPPKPPKAKKGPSRPRILEVERDPSDQPITVERDPTTNVLQIVLNTNSEVLTEAVNHRPPQEETAVAFVFKYGLALIAMALIEKSRGKKEWEEDEAKCRQGISDTASGLARVIVPLCLNLPKKLPKMG